MNKVTVQFHGNLAQFGESFTLYANTANEAIRSLAIQIDGLKQYLRKGYYRVKVDNKVVTQSEYVAILDVSDGSVIHVSPRVAGSGKWGTFIAGAALTVIGVIGNIYGGWGTPFIQAGIGLMVGGVAQMLIKPKNFNSDLNGVEDSKSSAFSNLANVVGQGKKIPRAYGDIRVGSVIASQSLSSYRPDGSGGDNEDDIQVPTYSKKPILPMPAEDPKGNPYRLDPMSDSMREAAVTITTEWS